MCFNSFLADGVQRPIVYMDDINQLPWGNQLTGVLLLLHKTVASTPHTYDHEWKILLSKVVYKSKYI